MIDRVTCQLCGWPEPRDLGTSLAHWCDAPQGMAYEHLIRCVDVVACRRRVAAQGNVWPLIELAGDRRAS